MSSRFQKQNLPGTMVKSSVTPMASLIQRKCACDGSPGLASECDDCSNKKLSLQRSAPEAEGARRHEGVPAIVHEVLRSSGQPLDRETRAFFEPRFGHTFEKVRVHTDARAGESAHAVKALAYTVGADVVFGAGKFAPHEHVGKRLLAHELAHVIQQSATEPLLAEPHGLRASSAVDPNAVGAWDDERRADLAAELVLQSDLPSEPRLPAGQLSGAGRVATKLQRAPTFEDCSTSQQTTIRAAITLGQTWVARALTELRGASGGISTHLGAVLDRNFHTRAASDIAQIITGFVAINAALTDSINYECESWCVGEKCGYVYAFWTDVHFCPSYFSSGSGTFQARCLVHELAHKEAGAGGDTYSYDSGYATLTPSEAINNADSYAMFAQEI